AIIHALPQLEPELARHERRLLAKAQVVHGRAVGPGDLEDVAEPGGGHQGGPGPGPLGQRVDDDRGPVDQEGDRGRVQSGLPDAVRDPGLESRWSGGRLGEDDPAALLVERDEVREGAADVRCHPDAHQDSSTPFRRAASDANRASSPSSQRPNAWRSAMTLYFS